MKVEAGLDNVRYTNKPEEGMEFARIKKRAANNWVKIELQELADYVGKEGCAILPGHLVGGIKAENCTGMQLFTLDFDDGVLYEEIKNRCIKWDLPIAFAYETLSSTPAKQKFRVVFAHDTLIDDLFVIKLILNILQKIFPECDRSCKNPDRLFLGGKKLLEVNLDAHLALVKLLPPFYEAMNHNKNINRNVGNFCNLNHILFINNHAAMDDMIYLPTILENGANEDNSIIHKIENTQSAPFFVLESKSNTDESKIENKKIHQSIMRSKKTLVKCMINSNSPCELLNRFISGEHLNHNARFAIYTNMLHIKGGIKMFEDVLNRFYLPETAEKWQRNFKYMKHYQPMICSDSFCPNYLDGSCVNLGSMVKTLKGNRHVIRAKREYCSLEEAEEVFKNNLEEAVRSRDTAIHLIKGQTAIGKTRYYTELIASDEESKFLIALPTNCLKQEVLQRLVNMGVRENQIYVTPSIRDGDTLIDPQVREEYTKKKEKGLHREAKLVLSAYLKELREEDQKRLATIKECEELLQLPEELGSVRVIVTTHAMFLHLPYSLLYDRTCIIDEDILLKQIFGNTHSISMDSVEILAQSNYPGYSEMAAEILQSEKRKYYKIIPQRGCKQLTEEEIWKDGLSCKEDDDINDLVKAGAFVVLPAEGYHGETVYYFCPEYLPQVKVIVLSATLNAYVYKQYFHDRQIIEHESKEAKYRGNVCQFTYHSLGRRDMAEKKDKVIEMAMDMLKKEGSQEPLIVTFKKFEKIPGCKQHGMHFGNAAGIDKYKGQNLAVIGTPYDVEFAYKLTAGFLGADVNSKEDERPRWRRISYRGDDFLMMTYRDEKLREVQLYAISSELEQCIGRARVLREKCTVFVFSCFPCEQAKLETGNYLLVKNFDERDEKEADQMPASL